MRPMKRSHLTAATMLSLIIAIGCGGSGGGNSSTDATTDATTDGTTSGPTDSTTSGPVPPTGRVTIEATNIASDNPTAPLLYIDLLNIETIQTLQFELVEYAADGTRTALSPVTSWTLSADSSRFATIAPSSGRFVSNRAGSADIFKVTARYLSVDYQEDFKVNNRQANLFSKIVGPDDKVVQGVTLEFFDTTGTTVGRIRQPVDGFFVASLPTNAVAFTVVDDDTLPAAFGNAFTFNGRTYPVGDRNNPVNFRSELRTNGGLEGNLVIGPNIFLADPSNDTCDVAAPYELDPDVLAPSNPCTPLRIQLVPK